MYYKARLVNVLQSVGWGQTALSPPILVYLDLPRVTTSSNIVPENGHR